MFGCIVFDFESRSCNLDGWDNLVNVSNRCPFVSVGLFAIDYWAIDCFALRGSSFIFDFEFEAGNFLSDFIWFSVLLRD